MRLWTAISDYSAEVQTAEQPFQRVTDFVRYANRKNRDSGAFAFDQSVIQVRGKLLAVFLLLKTEVVIFSDFLEQQRKGLCAVESAGFVFDHRNYLKECDWLVTLAKERHYAQPELEGHIFSIQFTVLAMALNRPGTIHSFQETIKQDAQAHLVAARGVLAARPSLAAFASEADAAERALQGAVFYRPVTTDEMRVIYKAMAAEFTGTGHWFTCARGHPFTIGECALPKDRAQCPECDAPVGWTDHQTAEGIRSADDIEALGREMAEMKME